MAFKDLKSGHLVRSFMSESQTLSVWSDIHSSLSKRFLLLFLLFYSCLIHNQQRAVAQDYLYAIKHYLIDPTMSENQVNSLVQDRNGLIWVATKRGVARFNGYQFDVFEGGDKVLDIPPGNVSKLEIVGDTLYIASAKGVLVLHTISFNIRQLKDDPSVGSAVYDMTKSELGTIYWCSSDGFIYAKKGMQISRVKLPFRYSSGNISLQLHGADIYVFDLYQGLVRIDTNTLVLKNKYRFPTEVKKNKMLIDHRDRLLCLTGEFVYAINADNEVPKKLDSLGQEVDDILNVDQESFVVKNGNQIWHQYRAGKSQYEQQISTDIFTPFRIYKLYQINRQIIATSTLGIILLQFTPKRFSTIYSTFSKRRNDFDVPRGMVEDNNHFYLGTYYTLGVFDKNKKTLFNAVKEPLSIHWMYKEADTMWLATEGNGLVKYLMKTRETIKLQPRYHEKQAYLKCMAKLGRDSFLLGGYQYLFLYDRLRQTFTRPQIRHKSMIVSDLEFNHIISLEQEGQILVATNKGIFSINRNWEVLQHYRAKHDTVYSDVDYTNAIWKSANNRIWAGTSNGVLQFEATGKLLHHFTRSDGLAGNKIASLVPDENQNLWVATFIGLSRIHKRNYEISNYFKEDGLPDNEFNHASFLLAENGDILLGTVKGFIRFSPQLFESAPQSAATIGISKIVYGSEDGEYAVFNPNKAGSGSIRLGKEIRYVKLYFFSNPAESQRRPQYEYRIEGIHANWVSMGNEPVLHLDNVKAGNFVLNVRMISGYGSKGILEASFPLVVQQYFYTAPWFYVLMIGTFLALIIGYLRLLWAREKRMSEVRRDISQDLHDELGSYLTGISMNMDLMQKNQEKERQYKETIRLLGKKALLSLKDGLWSLDPGSDTAEQLWDRIKSITKEMLESLDVPYLFSETSSLQQVRLTMLEKRNLIFIIKECITNSIKHGDGQMVTFTWENIKGRHVITIQNKIGQPTIKQDGGQGLVHIKNRMQHIRGAANFQTDNNEFKVILHLLFIHDRTRHYRR
jgi:ligand-binding sensor domain-containing protein